jgi:DNA polymerase III delta prime subunit
MYICGKEGMNLERDTIDKIIESSGMDIRQIINIL